jgi:hypothetical protein
MDSIKNSPDDPLVIEISERHAHDQDLAGHASTRKSWKHERFEIYHMIQVIVQVLIFLDLHQAAVVIVPH